MKAAIVGNLFFGLIISYFAFEIGKWIFKKTINGLTSQS